MSYLLGTDAYLDLVAQRSAGKVARWATSKNILIQDLAVSVVTLGQVAVLIEELPPARVDRQALKGLSGQSEIYFRSQGLVLDFDYPCMKPWMNLMLLKPFAWTNGDEVMSDTRMVIAQAMARGLTLATRDEPWVAKATLLGLQSEDPFV